MDRIPVSTVLLTKNSGASLPAYFASMRDIDDIVVLDGGSTDNTLDICKSHPNVRIFPQNPAFLDEQGYITDFSGIRNDGYAKAKHRWILCIDSDEEATEQLLSEVRRVVAEDKRGVYYVKRTFTLNGKPVVMLKRSTSDHIRLFHLDHVRGCIKPVHERPDIIPGAPIGYLNANIIVPMPTAAQMRKKYDRSLRIEVRANKGTSFSRWFRWIFLRNLFSLARRPVLMVVLRLLPEKGPRAPLWFEYEHLRYGWLLIWRTMPRP